MDRFKKALRAAGVRGHRDFKATLIYADYQPDAHERDLVQRVFARVVAESDPGDVRVSGVEA